jgi:hypothetical protein
LQPEAYSRYRHNTGKPVSAIRWLAYCYEYLQQMPMELDKSHILAFAAETSFYLFKEQVPLKV